MVGKLLKTLYNLASCILWYPLGFHFATNDCPTMLTIQIADKTFNHTICEQLQSI